MELIINTFGTALLKENDMFLVENKEVSKRIPPDKVKSIVISRGARISSDAALLAIDHEIDVMFVDNSGKPVGRLWSVKYGSISNIRRKQLDFIQKTAAVEWIKSIISEKLDNQIALLLSLKEDNIAFNRKSENAIRHIEGFRKKVTALNSEFIRDIAPNLRGWEGASAKYYFELISGFLPEKYSFQGRTQHPATDMFNCLLNYGYGILYGKTEGALIKAGIDPYVGILHRDEYNRPVLVYDVIEKYRVWIDYVVISLCRQEAIDRDCFSVKPDGTYWLEGSGKRILIQGVNDYLDEIITVNRIERSRQVHIELFCQSLAQVFINS